MLIWMFCDTKTTKAIFKPTRAFVLSIPYNYTIFGFHASYGAKNALKRHHSVFYSITHLEIYLNFRISRTRTRTRIYASKHQNSNSTHYGNHNTPAKKIFSKIFSFAKFEYLHQTLGVQNTPRPRLYVLSVFVRSFASACNSKKCTFFPSFSLSLALTNP